jgi:hypothetical protein
MIPPTPDALAREDRDRDSRRHVADIMAFSFQRREEKEEEEEEEEEEVCWAGELGSRFLFPGFYFPVFPVFPFSHLVSSGFLGFPHFYEFFFTTTNLNQSTNQYNS